MYYKIRPENYWTQIKKNEAKTIREARSLAKTAESGYEAEYPRAGIYKDGKLLEVWSRDRRIYCDILFNGHVLINGRGIIWAGKEGIDINSPLYLAARAAMNAGSLSGGAAMIGGWAGQDIDDGYGVELVKERASALVALCELTERPITSRAEEAEILIDEID